ncbi:MULTISPECIES: magnesium transporter [Altererythrobacter]|uniref:Magnesium transporter MgtE n=1 Tax=Altererythrobacter ishigakiensis TaxID=476157 RepID=A0A562UN19_9SPHN|nr:MULTISPECIES: magnesium transporter [Altererythrobacter]MBO6608679.1 magnesium transporter [Altererythrobacter sp.]MBO6642933.1 magnesium transporter [Altererythrobacter sp.]MBO6709676.1 magnesium transporter [Altererythrobacter sp.]TWJ07004.1 magnesium transporter [Altererythrobacter ishigakiensis]
MSDDARLEEEDLLTVETPPEVIEEEGPHPDDRIDDERHDEENRLKPEYIRSVREAFEEGDNNAVYDLVEPLHPADVADLLELFDKDERGQLAAAITDLMSSDVVAELNDHVREDMMEALPPEAVATIVEQLETDDAVQLIEDLDEDDQQAILAEVEAEDRAAIESALAYPEETAGRLMSRHFVAVPEHMNVGDLIDYMRREGDLAQEFYEVFVVDERHHPVGTCALSWVLTTPRHIKLTDVMKRDQTLIPVDADQEEVGLMFQKYNLISAAVVDENGRLVGQMTVDDIVHIISEEAGEDVLLLSGAGDGDINEPIREAYGSRVRWLVANLGTAVVGSAIIAFFGAAIEKLVALAVLMPIVASIGGNAGTQTMAVAVRAIATNQLTRANTWKIVGRELRVALLNGVTIAVLIGIATAILFTPQLGGVIAAAMVINIIVSGMAGVLVPVMFERLDQDPAVASSVFVTMITDSMGFFAFLGLAVLAGLA